MGQLDILPDDANVANCNLRGSWSNGIGVRIGLSAQMVSNLTADLSVVSDVNGHSYIVASPQLRVAESANASFPVVTRRYICFANSMVRSFSSGSVTLSLSELGITTNAKPVGILLTHQNGGMENSNGKRTVILRYDYDGSSASGVVITAHHEDGTAVSGNVRFFATVFQNSWTDAGML
jgi:hypothetical protein